MAKPSLKFLLREDLPRGFIQNSDYTELPVATAFLLQYEHREFKTQEEFEAIIKEFPDYLKQQQVPESSDKQLRKGFVLDLVPEFRVCNVSLRSAENRLGKCWFGTLGTERNLERYFQAQAKARRTQITDDDEW